MLNCISKSSHGRMEPYHISTTEGTGTHHWMLPLFHIVHTKKSQFIHRVLKQSGKFFPLSILMFPPIRLQKMYKIIKSSWIVHLNHHMTETTSLNPRTHKPSITQSKSAKPTSDSAATSRFPALFVSRKSRTWKIKTQITKNI